jgi:hypothetical protein
MTVTSTARVATERAAAADEQALDRVKDVTGRHLERFGEKDGLVSLPGGKRPAQRAYRPWSGADDMLWL